MKAARSKSKKVTWQRIADALEMSGRQSAERRFLQLSRPHLRSDSPTPRTQNERVETERQRRSRSAERQWAMEHAPFIRRTARQLAALDDLQERVDRSAETRLMTSLQAADGLDAASLERPTRRAWPHALRECLAEDEQFDVDPPRDDSTRIPTGRSNGSGPTSSIDCLDLSPMPPTPATSNCPICHTWHRPLPIYARRRRCQARRDAERVRKRSRTTGEAVVREHMARARELSGNRPAIECTLRPFGVVSA